MSTHGTQHEYADGLDESSWRGLSDEDRCECDDCGWRGSADDLNSIHHVHERVGEGETMPAGQCPECAALAYTAWGERTITEREKAETTRADAARAMLAALKAIWAESDGGWRTESATARNVASAIAAAETAGITPDDKAAAAARLDHAIAGELATALHEMWTAYGNNMERHAYNGDQTWTDEDHTEWQHAAGAASAAITTAKAAGITVKED